MFERFTDRARRVVVLAQEEARAMDHGHIGTEHILLGLIREGEGLAALVLGGCGVELEHVRDFVRRDGGDDAKPPGGHIPFTPHAKKVLELSLRQALQLGHNYIGTEHILLGLLKDDSGPAARALEDAGAEAEAVRQELMDRLRRDPGPKDRPGTLFTGVPGLNERLARIQESLDRIERHLGIQPSARRPGDGEGTG